ncbi:hypothetical protein EDD36DRAFT_459266 [Exophiala viscosa]|uniref:SET domain-containing protein n=1 Tax=Exophiala viscosa TaxID=2486360 RepID=A0AAN6E5J3_9EURO|nr:hypothetical protein EDD36DRAFT_459266 [Exophiala viscosa]
MHTFSNTKRQCMNVLAIDDLRLRHPKQLLIWYTAGFSNIIHDPASISIRLLQPRMPQNDVADGDQPLLRTNGLVLISNTPKGRGVFATQDIPGGTVIEVSPVLLFSEDEVEKHAQHTCLQHYTYYWPSKTGRTTIQALALGLGSMFNHSTRAQNVGWKRNTETEVIVYTALRDIKAGEELCISYGHARLWFKDADADADVEVDFDFDEAHEAGGDGPVAEIALSGLGKMEL